MASLKQSSLPVEEASLKPKRRLLDFDESYMENDQSNNSLWFNVSDVIFFIPQYQLSNLKHELQIFVSFELCVAASLSESQ